MITVRALALLAVAALVHGQEISTLEPCGQTCYNDTIAQFARFGCASATDVACMCRNPDFSNAIRDCSSQSCADPNYAGVVVGAANALCATATVAAPAPSTTPPPAPSTTPPAATSAPPPVTSSSSSSSSSSSTTSAAETAVKLTTSATPSTSTSSSAKTSSTGTHTSSKTAPAATTSAAAAVGASEGLTTPSKIGIGVGVVIAVAALIGVAVFVLLRRRQNKRDIGSASKHWKISEPMPVSNRAFGHDYSNSYETGLSELEMKSRRYEDMLPRQVPRQMV